MAIVTLSAIAMPDDNASATAAAAIRAEIREIMNLLPSFLRPLCRGHFVADDIPTVVALLGPLVADWGPPHQQAFFDHADDDVDHDDKGRQHEHAGEHAGDVEHAFSLLDQVAEAGRGAEIFAHHRAHDGKPTEVCSEENIQDS